MIRLHLILVLLMSPLFVCGQEKEKTADQKLFDEAFSLHQDDELDSALALFQQFRAQYPSSNLLPRVHYNIGYTLKELGRKEEAKVVLKEILESHYNEKDPGGGGLMGPQYAHYKHFSCEQLADLYISENDFNEAEKYVKLFDKKYPYEHFCGNERTAYEIFKAQHYAKVYDGQGKTDAAIGKLIPHVFYTGLASNDELLNDLILLLSKRYKAEEVKHELQKAVASLKISYSKKRGERASIDLFNFRVRVSDEGLYALGNTDSQANLNLEGRDKFLKVISGNALFKHYGVR